jgi:uncharacterized protein YecT (DUF1311 family)
MDTPIKMDCENQPTTFDINHCALASFEKAEKTRLDLYNHYRKRLEPKEQKKLDKSESIWIAFREADCDLESSGTEGGNIQPMVYQNCRENRTKIRIEQLQIWNTCRGGDLSCPAANEDTKKH